MSRNDGQVQSKSLVCPKISSTQLFKSHSLLSDREVNESMQIDEKFIAGGHRSSVQDKNL